MKNILVGNSFPMGLFRREATIKPETAEAFRQALRGASVFSFWGHRESLESANHFAGVYLTPRQRRPALTLSESGLPTLHGVEFRRCWVLTPLTVPGIRPDVGTDQKRACIHRWHVLRIDWH